MSEVSEVPEVMSEEIMDAKSRITEEIKAQAEVYHGEEMCKEKCSELLKMFELPSGLLPLENIIECGYVKETGFCWFKRKEALEYNFESLGRLVSYAAEVTGYIEKKKIKKTTGIKSKELLIWLTVSELSVEGDLSTGKITFKTPAGLFRTFPVTAFQAPAEAPAQAPAQAEEAS